VFVQYSIFSPIRSPCYLQTFFHTLSCMEYGRFPNKLKKYRRISGYSQKKVARALGFADTSVISRWEHGAVLPGLQYAFKLSKLYHTLPHELFDLLWNQSAAESLVSINSSTHEEEIYL
jgi:DNA-binding XRE family transcriptional regulator